MCGIYGSTVYYDDATIRAKLSRIDFRGPDYSAFERTRNLILGHNRLAIVDLDHRSNQPFTYKHVKVVFNGEIYNYQPLKAKLKILGYTFHTDSDTEVLAAAYLEYGEGCVDHFNGMFAFVIFDAYKQKLFGARDRLGKKPFYYTCAGGGFEFASQPSQITLGRRVTLDEQAINEYLVWGYIPEPRSAWHEIKKIEAGHIFTYCLRRGHFETKKYWSIDHIEAGSYAGTYASAKAELKHLLLDAIKTRLHADVPLGVFLSGGIDSSLIAALASQSKKNVKTFSIKFNEQGFDESIYARHVAQHIGSDHYEIECCTDEGMELIKSYGRYYDEPFADSSAIPSMLLSKHTKNHVTVALSGDGGDESFLGYKRYKWLQQANYIFKCPLALRRAAAQLASRSGNYRHKLLAMGVASKNIESLYALMFGGLEYSWMQNPAAGLLVPHMDTWNVPSHSILQKMSAFDIKTYLNGDINTKVDRASMAFALEARAPLMDHRVVAFARQLPDNFKFNGNVQKRILKDILFNEVPAQLFDRPKAGFTMPFRQWFRSELKEYVLDSLSVQELQNIPGINVKQTLNIIDEHMTGKWNRFTQIWKLLVLSQWLKQQSVTLASSLQSA